MRCLGRFKKWNPNSKELNAMLSNTSPTETAEIQTEIRQIEPRLSIFGLGYVGVVSTACFARCGYRVIGVDLDELKVNAINSGKSPIVEAGLGELLAKGVCEGSISATRDIEKAVLESNISLISVGTPSAPDGSCDLKYLRMVSLQIGAALAQKSDYHVIVFRSTMPPGSTRNELLPIIEMASGKRCGEHFGLCFNPEFLRESTAIVDFYDPPKTVIGAVDTRSGDTLASLYKDIDDKIIQTTLEAAEMVKYVDNTWHALKVSFANEIGKVCRASGIDSHTVMEIFVQDTKLNISPYYLKPGFAFGGSCLPKDVRCIKLMGKRLGVEIPIIDSITDSNQAQIDHAVSLIEQTGGQKICFLGITFKAGTDDLRESPVLPVISTLMEKGRDISIFDPNLDLEASVRHHLMHARHAKDTTSRLMDRLPDLVCTSVFDACNKADTIVVSHNSPLFRDAVTTRQDAQTVVDLVRLFEPQGSLSKIFAAGMNDYLQKPTKRNDILDKLTRWTGKENGQELRILIAEDDTVLCKVTEAILTKAGHRIETVGNGSQAVKALKRRHFDAVLMDISMPVMNGYKAATAIRALPGIRSKTPIIAMTALALPEQSRTYSGICW